MTEAHAQNRDDFPAEFDDKLPPQGEILVAGLEVAGSSALFYGSGLGLISHLSKKPIPTGTMKAFAKAGTIASQVLFVGYLVNKAHALLASSCEDQAVRLKQIMNRTKISLSEFTCSSNSDFFKFNHEQKANISFWTPDRKNLPFYANWETSELYVDRKKEIYEFDTTSLKRVARFRENRRILSGPEFEKYRTSLEPYRQVLAEIGASNSCHKCEEYFNKSLVQSAPGPYTIESRPTEEPIHEGSK